MLFTLFKGFIIGAGMIIPIGAQNSYVLTQGIKRNFHLTAATICIFCDFILMSLGVFGGGALVNSNATLSMVITWGAISFLTVYGALFFKEFLHAKGGELTKISQPATRKVVVFTTLAVTLLNPHVYLDTVVIIGSISGEFVGHEKWLFLLGTMLASLSWFYALSLGAAQMAPWLSQPKVQRYINLMVALVMWFIAMSLIKSSLGL